FETVRILAPGGETRAFDRTYSPPFKSKKCQSRVIDCHLTFLFRAVGKRAFLDKGLQQAADFGDFSNKEACQIDVMRSDIAQGTTPCFLFVQSPDQRKIRVDNPVLQVSPPEMMNLSQFSLSDHLTRQEDGWNLPVIVTDHVANTGLLHSLVHLFGFSQRVSQRLLTKHDFSRRGCGNRDVSVTVARSTDVDYIDIFSLDDLPPIGRIFLPSIFFCRATGILFVSATDHFHMRPNRCIKERIHLSVTVAVRLTHKGITNHRDVDSSHSSSFLREQVRRAPEVRS